MANIPLWSQHRTRISKPAPWHRRLETSLHLLRNPDLIAMMDELKADLAEQPRYCEEYKDEPLF